MVWIFFWLPIHVNATILDQENRLQKQERQNIGKWLSSVNFWSRQSDAFEKRQDGTGEWLLNYCDFQAWINGNIPVLYCPGDRITPFRILIDSVSAGVGKTVLAYHPDIPNLAHDIGSSVVINYLLERIADEEKTGLAFIYFNHKEKIPPVGVLGSILKYLAQQRTKLSKEVRDLYQKHIDRETSPTLTDLSTLLQLESGRFSKIFVVVDALDEWWMDDSEGAQLFSELQKLGLRLMLMITGRPHVNSIITSNFEHLVQVDIWARDADIRKFVEAQIGSQQRLMKYTNQDHELGNLICNTIIDKAKGM
jgi:hypothetical protein